MTDRGERRGRRPRVGRWVLGARPRRRGARGLCAAVPMSTPSTGNATARRAPRPRRRLARAGRADGLRRRRVCGAVAASVPGSRFGDAFDAIADVVVAGLVRCSDRSGVSALGLRRMIDHEGGFTLDLPLRPPRAATASRSAPDPGDRCGFRREAWDDDLVEEWLAEHQRGGPPDTPRRWMARHRDGPRLARPGAGGPPDDASGRLRPRPRASSSAASSTSAARSSSSSARQAT